MGYAQIPSFGQYGPSEAAFVFNPGGFEAGGASQGLYANKWMPSASDTLTKVWGNHTVKAGFFYEWIRNSQPANNNTNGLLQVSAGNSFSYGNEYADLLTGNLSNYNESKQEPHQRYSLRYIRVFWAGLLESDQEADSGVWGSFHPLPAMDRCPGLWLFDLRYGPICSQLRVFSDVLRLRVACQEQRVPVGGFPTRTLFYQPRFGVAYDVSGTGSTVVRGGWGRFYYHSGQFTNGLDASAGVADANLSPSNWVRSDRLSNQSIDWVGLIYRLPIVLESVRHAGFARSGG